MKRLATVLAAVVLAGSATLLGGCDLSSYDLTKADTPAICKALIGPIKYNTYNKLSKRYAAILLAMDLRQRNEVWQALHCHE